MTTFPPEPPQRGDDEQPAPPPPPPPSAPSAPGAPTAPSAPPPAPHVGYGAPMTPNPAGMAPAGNYADWPKRALSGLIDFFGPGIVANIAFYGVNRGLGYLLLLASLAWALYNAYLGGQTGQSYGKKIAGTRLISETTGAPIGGGMGIARYFVHIVDGIPCYLGFLWPLWDAKRQTFADKLLKTAVVTT